MKRIFALLLALLMLVSLVACNKDNEEEDGDNEVDLTVSNNDLVFTPDGNTNGDAFYYEYINGDEVSIIGFAASHVPHAITIPATIDNRPVTDIADEAFNSKTNITDVVIPEGVVSIGKMAFNGCTALKTVSIPSTVTSVGEAAFAGCILLGTVTLPAAVTEIGFAAFYNCKSLTAVTLPEAVTELPDQLFMSCERLKTVTWSTAGTKIGNYAFMNCAVLEGLTFPATLTEIGEYAFAHCAKQTVPTLAETVVVGANAFFGTVAP